MFCPCGIRMSVSGIFKIFLFAARLAAAKAAARKRSFPGKTGLFEDGKNLFHVVVRSRDNVRCDDFAKTLSSRGAAFNGALDSSDIASDHDGYKACLLYTS